MRVGSLPQVLKACLHPDPSQRATADQVLAMPYFNGITGVLPLDDLTAYPVSHGFGFGFGVGDGLSQIWSDNRMRCAVVEARA